MPIAADIVCLWVVTPRSYSQVDLRPNGVDATIELKRRLIVSGKRLHLFVFNAPGFKASAPNVLTFEEGDGTGVTRTEPIAHLADWHSPLIGSVTRTLVDALGGESGRGSEAALLVRFFSLVAAWRVPCRFADRRGSFCVAEYEMGSMAEPPKTLIVVDGSRIRMEPVRIVPIAEDRCCLLWRGGDLDCAYLDTGDELVELPVRSRSKTPQPDFDSWLADLNEVSRSLVLDGWADLSDDESIADLFGLDASFPAGGPIGGDTEAPVVFRIVASRGSLYAFVESSVGASGCTHDLTLTFLGNEPIQLTLQHRLCGEREICVYAAGVDGGSVPSGPVRATVIDRGRSLSRWFCLSSVEDPEARAWLRKEIAWHSADEKLVSAVGVEVIRSGGGAPRLPFPEVDLHSRPNTETASLLFVCLHNGDIADLRNTLIGLSSIAANASPRLRIIVPGEPTPDKMQAVYALCREQDVEATLVLVPEDEPVGPALAFRSEDRCYVGSVYLRSGAVPRDAGWWMAIAQVLTKQPGSVLIPSDPVQTTSPTPSARSLLAENDFALVIGPKVAEKIVNPRAAFLTFAGFLAFVIAAADRSGVLKVEENLRFHDLGASAAAFSGFGDARLDDAAITELLRSSRLKLRLAHSETSGRGGGLRSVGQVPATGQPS